MSDCEKLCKTYPKKTKDDGFRIKHPQSVMDSKNKYCNGQKVKDIQTGFTGRIMATAIYLNEVTQYQVQAESKDKNTYPQNAWFSENRLVVTK